MKLRAFALLFFVMPWCVYAQQQADYAPFSLVEDVPRAIILSGAIDFRSPLAFRRLLAARPDANLLVLNSGGGSVQAALLIAEEVFDRKMATVILPQTQCLSACAFIYFAGNPRLADGKLGVHQISGGNDLKEAQFNLSDILETLAKYGVTQEVITRMLRTPPEDMYVFSKPEIAMLGINREQAKEQSGPAPQVSKEHAGPRQEDMAKAFILGFIMSGSLRKGQLVEMSGKVYGETVTFYGKTLSRNEVLSDKEKYADRWPIRSSIARPSSVESVCADDVCKVTGIYDWSVSDPRRNKTSSGSATFEYRVLMKRGYQIIAEDGKVLARDGK